MKKEKESPLEFTSLVIFAWQICRILGSQELYLIFNYMMIKKKYIYYNFIVHSAHTFTNIHDILLGENTFWSLKF